MNNHNKKLFDHFARLKNPIVIIPPSSETNVYLAGWDKSLEELQRLVDGYIEPCAPLSLRERGIELLCNEEGLLKGLDVNEKLFPFFLVGYVVAVGVEGEDFVGLSRSQFEFLCEWLATLQD